MNRRGSFHAKSNAHKKTVSSLSGDATGGKYMTKKGRNGVIDVWWLDDTGGLTILLPNILRKKWHWKNCSIRLYVLSDGTNGKYSKRRRSNVAVIIVRIVFVSSFLFYCLLLNHSFQTNPNRITNCFKLFFHI